MKITNYALAAGLAMLSLSTGTQTAHAWPTGPSAKMAAQLKYNPPKNWVEHYLGDDRYKVVGGIWKVVSTDLDGYYHRPNCPNMLRQDAGTVIGFASHEDAEDAGYSPDPMCAPQLPSAFYGMATAAQKEGGSLVILGDGRSTVVLPSGWRKAKSLSTTAYGVTAFQDELESAKGEKVVLGVITLPASLGINFDQQFNIKQWKSDVSFFNKAKSVIDNQSGVVNSDFSQLVGQVNENIKKTSAQAVRLSGIDGIMLTRDKASVVPGGEYRRYLLPKGLQLYMVVSLSPSKEADNVVHAVRFK